MNNFPKISIVTPSYNQGHFIEETIISIVGQGYPNLEYIVMDGGSTDKTVEILKKYDKQITYWQSEKDKGQANAINNGFARATGDILMWLNSDDILLPNSLFYVAEQVAKNGDGFYFGNSIHFKEENGLWSEGSDVCQRYCSEDIKKIDYIIQPSSWWTRTVWEKVGSLDETIHFVFDWAWFIRVKEKFSFYPQNKVISLYRFHSEHKTGSGADKRQLEILNLLSIHAPREAKLYNMLLNEDDKYQSTIGLKLAKLKSRFNGSYFSPAMTLKFLKKEQYKDYTLAEIEKYRHL